MVNAHRVSWAAIVGIALGSSLTASGETLRGKVIAEDGSPAKGARVWAARLWTHTLERIETNADDRGEFSLEVRPGPWLCDSNLGEKGLTDVVFAEIKGGKPTNPLTFRLAPLGQLRVRLLEAESGRPIVGGRFVLDNGLDPVTDKDGLVEIPGLSRQRYHEAFVVAPGRERKRILFEMSEGPVTELDLQIPPGGRARGRVLDVDGKPIPGAYVGKSTSGSILSLTGLWTRADRDGNFVYDGIALDRNFWLNADAPGYQQADQKELQLDTSGNSPPLEFRLPRNPAAEQLEGAKREPSVGRRDVSGVVSDPVGKPVPGATVRWGTNQTSDMVETQTDATGSFRLSRIPDQPSVVSVIPNESTLAAEIAPISDSGDRDVKITLAKGHMVKGMVCNDRGEPFEGVNVTPIVGNNRQGLVLWNRMAKTDAQGRFQIQGLPGTGVLFTFLRSGVSDLRNHSLEHDKENVVTMSAAGAILGRVIDHEGKPVRSFRVLLNGPRERKPDDIVGGFFAGFCGIGLSYTSDKGYFVVRNLSAGSVVRLTILAPGHGELTIDRLIARPLMSLAPEKSVSYRLPRARKLKVNVVDSATQTPIPNARVSLILGDPGLDTAPADRVRQMSRWETRIAGQTNSQGVADFTPLSYAEATLVVEAQGHAPRSLGWRDSSTEITVALDPPGKAPAK